MLPELAIVVGSIIPSIVIGALVARRITSWRWAIGIGQAVVGAAIGFAAAELLGFTLSIVVATTVASQSANILAFAVQWLNKRQRRKALDGDFGEMSMWAAELVEGGDEEFALAISSLPDSELREIKIIAEEKSELRELATTRFEELTE